MKVKPDHFVTKLRFLVNVDYIYIYIKYTSVILIWKITISGLSKKYLYETTCFLNVTKLLRQ